MWQRQPLVPEHEQSQGNHMAVHQKCDSTLNVFYLKYSLARKELLEPWYYKNLSRRALSDGFICCHDRKISRWFENKKAVEKCCNICNSSTAISKISYINLVPEVSVSPKLLERHNSRCAESRWGGVPLCYISVIHSQLTCHPVTFTYVICHMCFSVVLLHTSLCLGSCFATVFCFICTNTMLIVFYYHVLHHLWWS